MKEGGAMIIRKGGKVYAGCPKDSLWTRGDNGWLDMYAGSSIINYGLLVAGKCNFTYGQTTLENHKGAQMFLGYSVDSYKEAKFINGKWPDGNSDSSSSGQDGDDSAASDLPEIGNIFVSVPYSAW